MNVASIASAFIAAETSQVQMAAAAKMMRMNAESAGGIAEVLEGAQTHLKSLANVAQGVGTKLDMSV